MNTLQQTVYTNTQEQTNFLRSPPRKKIRASTSLKIFFLKIETIHLEIFTAGSILQSFLYIRHMLYHSVFSNRRKNPSERTFDDLWTNKILCQFNSGSKNTNKLIFFVRLIYFQQRNCRCMKDCKNQPKSGLPTAHITDGCDFNLSF